MRMTMLRTLVLTACCGAAQAQTTRPADLSGHDIAEVVDPSYHVVARVSKQALAPLAR
jgi:hypothetical protein